MAKNGTELDTAGEYLAYWQRELRLEDRDIELRMAALEEMGDNSGAISAVRKYNGAVIIVSPKEQFEPTLLRFFRNDLEVRIVHELLHIKESLWRDNPKLSVMDDDGWIQRIHEECLDAIAEALVRVRRKIKR